MSRAASTQGFVVRLSIGNLTSEGHPDEARFLRHASEPIAKGSMRSPPGSARQLRPVDRMCRSRSDCLPRRADIRNRLGQ
jgi:hypothetical protein